MFFQYTSKELTDNCVTYNATQSMSCGEFSLKVNFFQPPYVSEDKLFSDIDDYVLFWHNSV